MHQLKKLVTGPQRQSLRYSQLPAPPMTELEFWAALVSDYPQTAQRLPTLTANKIRGGVPPPLRGVVWPSVAGARDNHLHEEFQRLSDQTSPFDALIGKDVGRSFPNVDMFREKDGEGQQMLGQVLKCFSLYDEKIGYCQGLGFVVGPLLMHMEPAAAFAVLVRLMEGYNLRACYLPDLAGLHVRIYQFQRLLTRHLPELSAHLESLKVEPLYVSQWFLSFFAVTCPLPMLLRIYDVILAEGATETLMRVALSLMQRNQKKLLGFSEFEDAMQFLLSRSLWDTYAQHADDLVSDFVSLTGLVSRESLQTLEKGFRDSQVLTVAPSLRSAASSLLGRFWAGSTHGFSKSGNALVLALPSNPALRKSSSGNSLTSTLNSEALSEATTATEVSDQLRKSQASSEEASPASDAASIKGKDKGLHSQIEDLLTALGEMQKQQGDLMRELQREREEREEDRKVGLDLLTSLKEHASAVREMVGDDELSEEEVTTQQLITRASDKFSASGNKRVSILQTKHQLRDAATEWKNKHNIEAARCQELMKQLDERENERAALNNQLRDARKQAQDENKEKQRLERMVQDLRQGRKSSIPPSPTDFYSPTSPITEGIPENRMSTTKGGLREFKLCKPDVSTFGKRSSSLNTQAVLSTSNHEPATNDALLLELVNAKTAEAVAKQELEETKQKLDGLRKILSGPIKTPAGPPRSSSSELAGEPATTPPAGQAAGDSPKTLPPVVAGGFFSGWGKRATST
jgi:Rab-GTPase-TBC domain